MLSYHKRVVAKLNRLIGVSYCSTYVYSISRTEGFSPLASPVVPSMQWTLLRKEEAYRLTEVGPADPSDVEKRMARGDVCYLASVDGRWAHFSWVQRSGVHPITEAAVSVPVAPSSFWIYNCHTVEWARGLRLYPATLGRIIEDHFRTDYENGWIYTSRVNLASQKGILRCGFRQVGTLKSLRLGSRFFRLSGPKLVG